MKKFFLFVALLVGTLAQAQMSFQIVDGDASGLKAIMDAWKAEILARDGSLTNFWPHGITLCDIDSDSDIDILASMHSNARGAIFENQFAQTGQVTFIDTTTAYVANHLAMPPGDGKYRCFDGDKDGRPDVYSFSDEVPSTGLWNDVGGMVMMDNTFGRAPVGLKLDKDEGAGIVDITGDGFLDIIQWALCPVSDERIFDPPNRRYIVRPRSYNPPVFPQAIQDKIIADCASAPQASHLNAYEYDLNGDAYLPDIVLSGFEYYNNSQTFMRILIKQADGTYVDETTARGFLGDSAVSMVEDLTGDGVPEFLLFRGAQPGYYRGQAGGTWSKEIGHCKVGTANSGTLEFYLGSVVNGSTISQSSPTQVRTLDFDFDGDLDVILHNTNPNGTIKVCQNNYNTLMSPVLSTVGQRGWRGQAMDLADMNGDCKIDIVHGFPDPLNHSTTSIRIYLNTSPGEAPPCGGEAASLPPDPECVSDEVLCVHAVKGPKQEFDAVQPAVTAARVGDTILVWDDALAGFTVVDKTGVTIRARGGGVIDKTFTFQGDGIKVERSPGTVIEGFDIRSAPRVGIYVLRSEDVVIRGNKVDKSKYWGIFTSLACHLRVEENIASNSIEEHGIYVSNSFNTCTENEVQIVRNTSFGNNKNGIQTNGDCNAGGDGIISGALIEDNIVYSNGFKGLSIISTWDSLIRKNKVFNNGLRGGAGGIHLAGEPGCSTPSRGNLVTDNEVNEPRIRSIRISYGASRDPLGRRLGNVIVDNILNKPVLDEVGGNFIQTPEGVILTP